MAKRNIDFASLLKKFKPFLMIPPIVLGAWAFYYLNLNSKQPVVEPAIEVARPLRVIQVPKIAVVPRIVAYGTAQPSKTWRAISEVSGRIKSIDPELKSGSIIAEGTVVLTIDKTDYELKIQELQAAIESVEADIQQSFANEKNSKASLKIQQEVLGVTQRELERNEELLSQRAASLAEVDTLRRSVLAQQQQIQEIQNSLSLLPSKRKSLDAMLAQNTAKLAQQSRSLEKTEIKAPFAMRIGEVALDLDQFVGTGETLFEAYNVDLIEVEARAAADKVRRLLRPGQLPPSLTDFSMDDLREFFDVTAFVKNTQQADSVPWNGRFLRIRESLDTQTRTVGVVLGVDNPYGRKFPTFRPPLIKGTYCEVTIENNVRDQRVVVPQFAITDGTVLIADDENRMRRLDVQVDYVQDDFAVLSSGLEGGETLIISNASPAIIGALVKPIVDEELLNELKETMSVSLAESVKQRTQEAKEASGDSQ